MIHKSGFAKPLFLLKFPCLFLHVNVIILDKFTKPLYCLPKNSLIYIVKEKFHGNNTHFFSAKLCIFLY